MEHEKFWDNAQLRFGSVLLVKKRLVRTHCRKDQPKTPSPTPILEPPTQQPASPKWQKDTDEPHTLVPRQLKLLVEFFTTRPPTTRVGCSCRQYQVKAYWIDGMMTK
jgi:hypothetical protein